jgi:hypothetical protein
MSGLWIGASLGSSIGGLIVDDPGKIAVLIEPEQID